MTRKREIAKLAIASFATALIAISAAAQGDESGGGSHTAAIARWHTEIALASRRFGIPEPWIEAVMVAESGGQTLLNGKPITSPKGAMGLMQVMPATYADMRLAYGLGKDPYLPIDNILAGTAYLRLNYDRFGYPGLFAAYNAGPDRYCRSLTGGTLPVETQHYLTVVRRRAEADAPKPDSILLDLSQEEVAPGASVFVRLTDQ